MQPTGQIRCMREVCLCCVQTTLTSFSWVYFLPDDTFLLVFVAYAFKIWVKSPRIKVELQYFSFFSLAYTNWWIWIWISELCIFSEKYTPTGSNKVLCFIFVVFLSVVRGVCSWGQLLSLKWSLNEVWRMPPCSSRDEEVFSWLLCCCKVGKLRSRHALLGLSAFSNHGKCQWWWAGDLWRLRKTSFQIKTILVCIPAMATTEVPCETVARIQTKHPASPLIIPGHFIVFPWWTHWRMWWRDLKMVDGYMLATDCNAPVFPLT